MIRMGVGLKPFDDAQAPAALEHARPVSARRNQTIFLDALAVGCRHWSWVSGRVA
jgi:hypothetical protein